MHRVRSPPRAGFRVGSCVALTLMKASSLHIRGPEETLPVNLRLLHGAALNLLLRNRASDSAAGGLCCASKVTNANEISFLRGHLCLHHGRHGGPARRMRNSPSRTESGGVAGDGRGAPLLPSWRGVPVGRGGCHAWGCKSRGRPLVRVHARLNHDGLLREDELHRSADVHARRRHLSSFPARETATSPVENGAEQSAIGAGLLTDCIGCASSCS